MFSAGELATMRAASTAAMPDTFRVEVPGEEVETASGGVYNEDGTTVDIPCRKAPVGNGPQERFLAERIALVGLEVIVFPWDADVSVDTVGTWIHGESGRSQTFEVKALPEPTYLIERRALVAPVL